MPLLRSLSVTRKGIHARCDGMGACSAESDSPDCCINSYTFSARLALGHSRLIRPVQPYPPDTPSSTRKGYSSARCNGTGVYPSRVSGDRFTAAHDPRTRNRQSMSGEASLATRNKAFQATRSRPASSHRGAAQALPTRQALGHGRHQAIRAAIPTAMPGKSRRMPLSSVTRGIPIDLAKATNSQS